MRVRAPHARQLFWLYYSLRQHRRHGLWGTAPCPLVLQGRFVRCQFVRQAVARKAVLVKHEFIQHFFDVRKCCLFEEIYLFLRSELRNSFIFLHQLVSESRESQMLYTKYVNKAVPEPGADKAKCCIWIPSTFDDQKADKSKCLGSRIDLLAECIMLLQNT